MVNFARFISVMHSDLIFTSDHPLWDQLAADGYGLINDFLTREEVERSLVLIHLREEEDRFHAAGIGALGDYQKNRIIRGDYICWLDPSLPDHPLQFLFDRIRELLLGLNRYCYLGLQDFEFHLAYYPAGSYYRKHLDSFRGRHNRIITVVCYLNLKWQPGDGGELVIYPEQGGKITVEPTAGKAAVFLSETIPHEVLEARQPRFSITGWLTKTPLGTGFLLQD